MARRVRARAAGRHAGLMRSRRSYRRSRRSCDARLRPDRAQLDRPAGVEDDARAIVAHRDIARQASEHGLRSAFTTTGVSCPARRRGHAARQAARAAELVWLGSIWLVGGGRRPDRRVGRTTGGAHSCTSGLRTRGRALIARSETARSATSGCCRLPCARAPSGSSSSRTSERTRARRRRAVVSTP